MAMLNRAEIIKMGFASVGENVSISDRASFYNCSKITIGNNVRIDDFCVLAAGKGEILIKNYVHIGVGSSLIGAENITMSNFSGLSSRVSIYSSSDDYSGLTMTNPTIPSRYTNVKSKKVLIGKHVIIGSGSIILPGVTLEDGVAVGALSLINRDCKAFGIYAGSPAKRISERKRDLLELEKEFLQKIIK